VSGVTAMEYPEFDRRKAEPTMSTTLAAPRAADTDTDSVDDVMRRSLCEVCPAHVYVMTRSSSDDALFWCGHHFAKFQAGLLASGATVAIDIRSQLTVRDPSSHA
jgi:hypothetical protein